MAKRPHSTIFHLFHKFYILCFNLKWSCHTLPHDVLYGGAEFLTDKNVILLKMNTKRLLWVQKQSMNTQSVGLQRCIAWLGNLRASSFTCLHTTIALPCTSMPKLIDYLWNTSTFTLTKSGLDPGVKLFRYRANKYGHQNTFSSMDGMRKMPWENGCRCWWGKYENWLTVRTSHMI